MNLVGGPSIRENGDRGHKKRRKKREKRFGVRLLRPKMSKNRLKKKKEKKKKLVSDV